MMETKVILATVVIVTVIVAGSLFFVNFQKQNENQNEKRETPTLKTLSLTLNDLPPDYEITYEDNSNESYNYYVVFRNLISNSDRIDLELYNLGSTIGAAQNFEQNRNILLNESTRLWNKSNIIDPLEIGDEGFYAEFSDESFGNNPVSHMIFRVSDIYCYLYAESEDYDFILSLAEIVEQRIYDSLE